MRRLFMGFALCFLTASSACAQNPQVSRGPGEWKSILDASATGWRGYRQTGLPNGWKVVDSALTRVGSGGDIVYGAEQFGDFELELEWKIQPRGNSGIFFRANETTERIYENAPEVQVIDNIGHPDNATELTLSGSNYALHPAPRDAVRPVGEWNSIRLVVRGSHVEHWLNGKQVVSYELWSPDWEARVTGSKFRQWPSYGRATRGFIGLQDHGDWVAYRRIRVRSL